LADALQIVFGILVLMAVFVLTQWAVAFRIKRACRHIIQDLETRQAVDAESAVALPYARKDFFRIGIKDFRPKALESLVAASIVSHTGDGKYYLLKRGVILP